MKKIVSVLLCASMIAGTCVPAFADDGAKPEEAIENTEDGTMTIFEETVTESAEDTEEVTEEADGDASEEPSEEGNGEETTSGINGVVLTKDHVAYVSGSKGCFNPKSGLTRAEFASIISKLIVGDVEITATYTDVSEKNWFYNAVTTAGSLGLFREEGDAFRPHDSITRAEVLYALAQFYPLCESEDQFTDVPENHFAAKELSSAKAMGWVSGYGDGTFRPDAGITRSEAVTMINKVLGRTADRAYLSTAKHIRCYKDVVFSDWSYYNIMEASTTHEADTSEGTEAWISHTKTDSGIAGGRYLINGWLYEYSSKDGIFLRNTASGTFTYDKNGHYTTGSADLDRELRKVILENYDYSKSQEQNLRIFYEWTRDSFTYLRRAPYSFGATGWWQKDAYNMLTTRYGNCYSYASTFYYLSRWIGYDSLIFSGTVGSNHSPHGWVEIDFDGTLYIFDTELDMAYRAKKQYLDIFYKMDKATRTAWAYIR